MEKAEAPRAWSFEPQVWEILGIPFFAAAAIYLAAVAGRCPATAEEGLLLACVAGPFLLGLFALALQALASGRRALAVNLTVYACGNLLSVAFDFQGDSAGASAVLAAACVAAVALTLAVLREERRRRRRELASRVAGAAP